MYLCDPVLSADPALRNLVIVALIQQTGLGTTRVNSAFKLWWLQMDDDTSTIVASGRLLTRPDRGENEIDSVSERMPAIAVGFGGRISVFYLARKQEATTWQLRAVKLEIDHDLSPPRIVQGSDDDGLIADGFAMAPLVVSTDARVVHALDSSGEHREQTIAR